MRFHTVRALAPRAVNDYSRCHCAMARQVVFASLCVAAALLPTRRTRTPSPLSAKKTVWTFEEAREYARSFGFGSKDEYVEYRCPGAYALPRDPVAAFGDRWTSWRVAASFYIL